MALSQADSAASDADADGEEDVEMIADPEEASNAPEGKGGQDLSEQSEDEVEEVDSSREDEQDEEAEGDDDAEGEEDEEDEEEEEQETGNGYHGAVKIPDGKDLGSDQEDNDASSDDDSAEVESASESSDDSSSESGAENEWDVEQVGDNETEVADIAARNDCIFCGQDEEHDPGEDYEDYLACSVCGDNAHRQCAREKESFKDDTTNPAKWRCPSCTENGLDVDEPTQLEEDDNSLSIHRRLSISSSRITRDLLPATRGTPKPGSHSIFNTLILEDDPGDGVRSLRKRKSSEATEDVRSRASSKRPKTSDSKQEPTASPVATGRSARSTTAASRTRRASAVLGLESDQLEVTATSSSTRPQRQRRPKKEKTPNVRVLKRTSNSMVLVMKVDLSQVNFRPPKRKRGPGRRRSSHHGGGAPLHAMAPYTTPYYAFHDRENDDSKKPPYGGILDEEQADTSLTMPTAEDRAKFEGARIRAEEDWKKRSAAAEAAQESKGRASQKVSGPPSKIKSIIFGKWEIDTWYAAPYPEEYSRNRMLYICEFCLKYMGSDFVAWRHKLKCPCKHPPGDEIYRDRSISIFEVDGRKNPAYCQNLCLLAKLFLGSKTLYYDVEPFLFYIMTEYDKHGYHFVGYFSKEKRPSSMNNVSCILTMPHHQRKGYGHLLIDFSYLLTRKEGRIGSPEKPLSDMGLVSYRNYWRLQLCYLLIEAQPGEDLMSVRSISEKLGMTADDVISQLEALRVLVRDPLTKSYAFRLDKAYFKETIEKWEAKGHQRLNADRLVWTPYIMSRTSNLAMFDRPPIATVAPREDGDDETVAPEEGVQQQLEVEKRNVLTLASVDAANGTVASDFVSGLPHDPSTAPHDMPMQSVSEMALSSPAKPPPAALTLMNGTSTPTNAELPQSPIPPWRYELWPPVPGTIYRSRRGGYRPKGSRITANGPVFGGAGSPSVPSRMTPRGSRASLRVSMNNRMANGTGESKGMEAAHGAQGKDGGMGSPSARRSTRSLVGTPGLEALAASLDGEAGIDLGSEDGSTAKDEDDEEEEEEAQGSVDVDEGDEDEQDEDESSSGDEEEVGEGDSDSDSDDEEEEEHEELEIEVDVDGDAEADEDYEDAEEDAEGEDEDEEEDVHMDE